MPGQCFWDRARADIVLDTVPLLTKTWKAVTLKTSKLCNIGVYRTGFMGSSRGLQVYSLHYMVFCKKAWCIVISCGPSSDGPFSS